MMFNNDRFIQSSGLSGPIPPSIALLENMTDLSVNFLIHKFPFEKTLHCILTFSSECMQEDN